MSVLDHAKTITTKYPTYLEALLQENDKIRLVYKSKPSITQEGEELSETDTTLTIASQDSILDLTGQPLQVDLGGDDTIEVEVSKKTVPASWTFEEARQHPISLNVARNFINNALRKSENQTSIFCVCDGGDQRNTVLLGSSQENNTWFRTSVHVLPCCKETDSITSLEFMKNNHLQAVRGTTQVEIQTMKSYVILGCNLKNCLSLHNSDINGSISFVITDGDSHKNRNNKMVIQAIAGHSNSAVKKFWDELQILQRFNNLIKSVVTEATILNSESVLECSEITTILSHLLNNVYHVKERVDLDLENLRQEHVLDKLWVVLKGCHTVGDLRDSLFFFFEELLETERRLQIPDDDQSVAAEIISGINNGKIILPTLSFLQCLELLIDLGAEKMKRDYLILIRNFNFLAENTILHKWKELSKNVVESNPSLQGKSRITMNQKMNITDNALMCLKIAYLTQIHKVVELFYVFKQATLSSDVLFEKFSDMVCKQFLESIGSVSNKLELTEFVLNHCATDVSEFVDGKYPVNWSVTLSSKGVKTVYYFSDYPIVPPCVFSDYSVDLEDMDSKVFYVTQALQFVSN